jgi:hypothetical protein
MLHNAIRDRPASGHEVNDAEAQLSALKVSIRHSTVTIHSFTEQAIDCESFAALALYRKLRKDKHIMSHPDAPTAMAAELPSASIVASAEPKPKTAEAIIESRLASSKLLAKGLNGIVMGLRTLVLGPKVDERGSEETGSESQLPVGHAEDEDGSDTSDRSDNSAANANEAGWKSGSISQDDSGDSEDSTDLSSEVELPPTKRQKKSTPPEAHIDDTDLKAKKKQPLYPSLKDDSIFLPSLSVGFTKGDSDISGNEIDSDAGSVGPARKNRRGQRARQQ